MLMRLFNIDALVFAAGGDRAGEAGATARGRGNDVRPWPASSHRRVVSAKAQLTVPVATASSLRASYTAHARVAIMDNGNGDPQPPLNQLALAPNTLITPENYWQHLQQLQRVKEGLAQYERELQAGYNRYVAQEQELRQRVEAGRQAERMLSQLQTSGNASAPAPSNHARLQAYPQSPNPQNGSSSSNLQTFPPANAQPYHSPHGQQPNAMAYQQAPTMVVPYGQAHPPQPYHQASSAAAAQYPHNWPQYVAATNWQTSAGHAQGQRDAAQQSQQPQQQHRVPTPQQHQQQQRVPTPQQRQQQQHVPISQQHHATNGTGHAPVAGASSRQPVYQPGPSGSSAQSSASTNQRTTPEEIKRAKVTYASQAQQQQQQQHLSQVHTAATAYQKVFDILKELRPEMVDYIIFAALDSLRSKLPNGSVQGQSAFLKVQSQLPPHSVEQLTQISQYVVHQLQALEPAAIKAIVLRIKRTMMQNAQQPPVHPQQVPGGTGSAEGQYVQAQPPALQPHPAVVTIPSVPVVHSAVNSVPTNTPVVQSMPQPLPVAPVTQPSQPPSQPPAPAHVAGYPEAVRSDVVTQAHGGVQEQPSVGQSAIKMPNIQFQQPWVPTSPTRQTVFTQPRAQAPVTPPNRSAAQPPFGSTPNATGERPKSPWTPAKADKARLARDIMQSLGRASRSSQPPASSSAQPSPSSGMQPPPTSSSQPPPYPGSQLPSTEAHAVGNGLANVAAEEAEDGVEVEEIATDGAFELAVWQQAAQETMSRLRLRPRRARHATTAGHVPTTRYSSRARRRTIHARARSAPVPEAFGAASPVRAVRPPAQFPSIGDFLDLRIHSLGAAYVAHGDAACSSGAVDLEGVGSTAEGPQYPATPSAEAGPSKTPLFFPSPASEHNDERETGSPDAAEVFANAYMQNESEPPASPPRIPSHLKGKARIVYSESDEDEGTVLRQPQRKKARVEDSNSEVEVSEQRKAGRNSQKRAVSPVNRAYVLVPPMPKWAQQLLANEYEKSRKRRGRKASTPETVPDSQDEMAVDDEIDEARLREEQAQQELVQMSLRSLHESPCQWRGCGAIMASMERLTQHVRLHAEERVNAEGAACDWVGCTRTFGSKTVLANHLTWHASKSVICVFEGCEKSFATQQELLRHHRSGRHRAERMKPPATPFTPDTLAPLPPLPELVLTHMLIPRRVTRHPISKVVHNWLSAKVLENLASFNFAGRRGHHNAPSRSSRRLADKVAVVEKEGKTPAAKVELLRRITQDAYVDVAHGPELKAAMRCEDIASYEVTRLCELGLVLFPPPEMERENSVEPKSEPDELDFLHDNHESNGGHDGTEQPDTAVSEPAVHLGQQDEASHGGAAGSSSSAFRDGTAAGGAMGRAGTDGQSHLHASAAHAVERRSPLPGWEVLPSASASKPPTVEDLCSSQEGNRVRAWSAVAPCAHEGAVRALQGQPAGRDRVHTLEPRETGPALFAQRTSRHNRVPSAALPCPPALSTPATSCFLSLALSRVYSPAWPHFYLSMLAPGPTYISSRSADVILSDVRPIKLAYEALHAVNVLLDELLYTILNEAQSLSTDRLKASLLKVVPTSWGKKALLEAEVELKAYLDRNIPSSTSGNSAAAPFSLQWSFELLRLKCEAYSTMNDSDEDGEAERRLSERMKDSSVSPPQTSEVAPAALYLTAILESICEHILGKISSVATRDSSRTVASSQDVFTALCEDDSFYGTFKTLKVYEQIEQLSKAQRPRRSKSFTRGSDRAATRPSRTPSATQAELAALRDGASTPARSRLSMESLRSSSTATATASPEGWSSMERGKSLRRKFMTHSRSSSEKEADSRSQSDGARSRASGEFEEDDELAHEFDELMRSGSTVKVSLTPDRLGTMQVFNRERAQRAKQAGSQFSDSPAGSDDNAHALSPERPHALPASAARPIPRRVDSIVEDEEEPAQANYTTMPSAAVITEPPRVRQASKSFTSNSAVSSAAPRFRSISISDTPHPRHQSRRSQDRLPNGVPVPGGPVLNIQKPGRQNSQSTPATLPPRTRKVARHRESLDLDDVMNGLLDGEEEEEEEEGEGGPHGPLPPPPPTVAPLRIASPSATPITPAKPKAPHLSASARDLIAFLDEGPPGETERSPSAMTNASVISFGSSKTMRTGKLSRMMSKLTMGNTGSQERLNGRYSDDTPNTPPRSLGRKPSNSFGPPTAFKTSVTPKRSNPNVVVSPPHAASYPQTPVSPLSVSSSTRTVSPPATAPPIPRTLSIASSVSDDLQTLSTMRSGSLRTASGTWDEFGSEASVSRDGSLHSQSQDEDGSYAGRSSRQVPIISPVPRTKEDKLVPPSSPRRSPIPRKPVPSSTANGNGHASVSKEASQRNRKPSTSPSPTPGIAASDVADLRKYLGRAETADECRLLVDLFFASHGFPVKPVTDGAVPELPELPRFMSLNELESSYAELFLSGDSIDFAGLADETSSEGSSASSRDFLSPASEPTTSPTPLLETVQE
ncbi:uncharacterized protein B0H18DRAFT_1104153 [Fomitopsis serialis]|uniref:uncharacterized protein n=1 Tax=Fomitopsis serialis TaxID=139415 RepID=UPI002007586C|nr:uncharacterized protein B0H18DRAFT_1104153 [Neoantrodia serialis]KAH9927304.1 hypothetical protein B0H18DRAFT_1104153 [Neoantrodia serialis]